MLLGMARTLKAELGSAVVCTLQGEAPFLDALPEPYREVVRLAHGERIGLREIAERVARQGGFALRTGADEHHRRLRQGGDGDGQPVEDDGCQDGGHDQHRHAREEQIGQQGHHPDIYLAWGRVRVDVWTHKINGLTESDFVLAARIDRLAHETPCSYVAFDLLADRGTDLIVSLGREGRDIAKIDATSQPRTAAMAERLQSVEGKAAYRRRKHIVEPPNGWIKSVLGFRQFSLRGLEKVRAEWKLVTTALNLRRMAYL